jgi:hypothetical protein
METKNEQLDAEKKEEFLKEYGKLVEKYGYDWYFSMQVVKISKSNRFNNVSE